MRCPCCEKPLIVTHEDHYESLEEHVSYPNLTPSLKQGYQCLYEYCIANNLQAVWIEDGSLFIESTKDIKSVVANNVIKKCSKSGIEYALDSFNYKYESRSQDRNRRKRSFNFLNWKIVFYPTYSNKEDLKRNFFKREIQIWKKDFNGYTNIIPLHRMVQYRLNNFFRHYRKNSLSDIESCINIIYSKDDRIYAKIASLILRIFYFRKVIKIKKAYELKVVEVAE